MLLESPVEIFVWALVSQTITNGFVGAQGWTISRKYVYLNNDFGDTTLYIFVLLYFNFLLL